MSARTNPSGRGRAVAKSDDWSRLNQSKGVRAPSAKGDAKRRTTDSKTPANAPAGPTKNSNQPCLPATSSPSPPAAPQEQPILAGHETEQEIKRPILRVNLIKKSSKSGNSLLANRQPFSWRVNAAKQQTSNVDKSNNEAKDKTTDTNKREPNQPGEQSSDTHNSQCIEAKKSQKLVLSLIKDISKTVSREDLNELLKEIHSAIGHFEESTASPVEAKQTVNNSSASGGDQNLKNRSRGKKSATDVTRASNNSKAFKVSVKSDSSLTTKNDSDHLNTTRPTGESAPSIVLKRTDDKPRSSISKNLIETSSDDENTPKSVSRLVNSSRLPDRCLRITSSHAKYISPHRKRSLEERLSRAQEAREKFLEYRANKFREILKKVEEMRAWKEEDTMNLKASVQIKLQKAAIKRQEQLDKIIRKAHDEDSKVSEIQFINNLEAQNRRYDLNSRKKDVEARLQDLQDERQKRFEDKQAKEAAAEERRKTLEAERKAKLLEIQQRRKLKNQKVEQQQQVREKKRIEKNRHREEKITAIKEAYNFGVQTLKKRINQKQEQSERRHEVNLRLIRQKAFELSIQRYNSFLCGTSNKQTGSNQDQSKSHNKQTDSTTSEIKRLQLKPFNTKKFCNLCEETISSEASLFSHLRSEVHYTSINEHYGDTMLTTNEAVEIHNLKHIVDTDEPIESDKGGTSDDQQSSRASSLVNYYHSSHMSAANGGICMSENDRDSLLAIERKCRKLRHKLILAGKPFNRDWFTGSIRSRLAQLVIMQRQARNQTTNTEPTSLANTIDLSANNVNCSQNKPFYLKINRITRELINVTTDQRISGGGIMPAGIIHSVDRLLADLNKQLASRNVPQLAPQLLYLTYKDEKDDRTGLDPEQLAMAIKMIEFYAIDALFLYDIVTCLVTILRRIVPNVSLINKLPSTVATHYSTLIDPISLNSYYCHRSPVLPARIYIRMIGMLQNLCQNHSDLCYVIFQSNNMINLSDILSYRLGFIIGNESPPSSISGSSSAATLSAHTIENKTKQQKKHSPASVVIPPQSTGSCARPFKSAGTHTTGGNYYRSQDASNRGRIIDRNSGGTISSRQLENNDSDSSNQSDDDDDDQEAEFRDRAETYKRTDEIVDDMTAGLCKLLATVTETILSRPLVLFDRVDKSAFGQRSDDFISYMVSVGIVDTESVIMSHIHQQQHHNHGQNHHSQRNYLQQQLSSVGGAAVAASNANSATTAATQAGGQSDKAATSGSSKASDASTGPSQPNVAPANSLNGWSSTSNGHHQAQSLSQSHSHTAQTHSAPSFACSTTSNKITNFTTSCIQFVTSLVKLVIAKLPDGSERELVCLGARVAQQDTTQLLATLKMTQLSGVLTLVYDMLVQSFNSLAEPVQPAGSLSAPDQQPSVGRQQPAKATAPDAKLEGKNEPELALQLDRQLNLALHSLRLINYVAYIDVKLLQDILASDEMLSLQLRHVCSYLISHLVRSAHLRPPEQSDRGRQPASAASSNGNNNNPSTTTTTAATSSISSSSGSTASTATATSTGSGGGGLAGAASRAGASGSGGAGKHADCSSLLIRNELMNEIILLLGNFAYLNEDNQLMLMSGRQPTIIEQLVALPFDFFSRPKLKLVLMPTLISCAHLSEQTCSLICQELSLSMLTSFIDDQLLEAQVDSKQPIERRNRQHSLVLDQLISSRPAASRWRFERRFAKSKWLSAKKYLEGQQVRLSQ